MAENEKKEEAALEILPALRQMALHASALSEQTLLNELAAPVWESHSATWESFVPYGLREAWNELPMEIKFAVYLTAFNAFDCVDLD